MKLIQNVKKVLLESIFVNKAFTSCSGIDIKAGITVNSIISTYIYNAIPDIKRQWFMMIKNYFDSTNIGYIEL